MDLNNWPKIGDSLEFVSAAWAFHSNVKENGKLLKAGQSYIVTKIEVYSSWAAVWLEGFGDKEFALHFFNKRFETLLDTQ